MLITLIQIRDPEHFSSKLDYNFSVSSRDLFIKNKDEYADARRISTARLTPGVTKHRRKILLLINHGWGLKESGNHQ